jgi:hypothetical protein
VQRFFSRRGGIFFEQFNGVLSIRGSRWSGPQGEGQANPLAESRRDFSHGGTANTAEDGWMIRWRNHWGTLIRAEGGGLWRRVCDRRGGGAYRVPLQGEADGDVGAPMGEGRPRSLRRVGFDRIRDVD